MQSVLLLIQAAPHAEALVAALEALSYRIVARLTDTASLHPEVVRLAPDVVIACIDSPTEPLLQVLQSMSDACPRPVVIFASDASRDAIRCAVDAGASAYVVEGWARERVAAIIDAACARFDAYQSVRTELAAMRDKLSERKLIEKAKGMVMQQRGLTEDQAYRALRKMAMDHSIALAEAARRVIAVAQLLA